MRIPLLPIINYKKTKIDFALDALKEFPFECTFSMNYKLMENFSESESY